jgi:hypothetical protein
MLTDCLGFVHLHSAGRARLEIAIRLATLDGGGFSA